MKEKTITALEFLEKVVESLGLTEIDGFIVDMKLATKTQDEDGSEVITSTPVISSNGYPYVMPRTNMLSNLFEKNEFGQPELKYLPFNCINEDLITGKSEAVNTMVKYIQSNINCYLYDAGLALIQLLQDDSAIKNKNIGTSLQEFLANASELGTSKTKLLADNNTINLWKKIYTKVANDNSLYSFLNMKTGGIIGDVKYARVASINFPLLEELDSVTDDEMKILDLKLRPKDLQVLKLVFSFLLDNVNSDYCIVVGSNHNNFPAFEAAYRLYLDLMEKFIMIKDKLGNYLDPTSSLASAKSEIKLGLLVSNLNDIVREINNIPSEKELLVGVEREEKKEVIVKPELPTTQREVRTNVVVPEAPRTQQFQEQPVYREPENNSSVSANDLNRVFGGYGNSFNTGLRSPIYVSNGGYGNGGYSDANSAYLGNYQPTFGGYNGGFSNQNTRMTYACHDSIGNNYTYSQRMNSSFGGYSNNAPSAYDLFMSRG